MFISICDDSKKIVDKVYLICRDCLGNENEIMTFDNGFDLLNCQKEMNLIILDIEMPGIDGIEVKDEIRKINNKALVIFLTNHSDYMKYAFDVNVLGFIEKIDLKFHMPRMLEKANHILNQNTIIDGLIHSDDVLYVKSEHNYGRLKIVGGKTHLVRKSMKSLEEELTDYNFVRIHREYLVNMKWIDKISLDCRYVWVNEEKLHVSTRLKGNVKEEYESFCKRNARYC